jgi:hypothetical protein
MCATDRHGKTETLMLMCHFSQRRSLPIKLIVEEDSALAMQLRIAKDNLRKSPTAVQPAPFLWPDAEIETDMADTPESDYLKLGTKSDGAG